MTHIAEPVPIDVKQAVRAAMAYVKELLPNQAQELRLEEVEQSDDAAYWLITVGFSNPVPNEITQLASPIRMALTPQRLREYKQIKVDRRTGEVVSMKIRVP